MDIKAGDVVTLKSGGPKMTVKEVRPFSPDKPEIVVNCFWFEKEEKITCAKFSPEMLLLVQE
jgi:uncharacterized protein YodC (DUF2158 family)